MKERSKGFQWGLLAVFFAVGGYPATRYFLGGGCGEDDPFAMSLIRCVGVSLFFLPFVLGSAGRRRQLLPLALREWKKLLLLGISGGAVQGVLIFFSMKYTTASRCSLLANASPVFTAIGAWFFLKEKITRTMLVGICIGFIGISLALLSRNSDVFSHLSSLSLCGDLLALLSGVAWSVYTIAGASIPRQYDSLCVLFFTFLIGTLCMPVGMLCYPGIFSFAALPLRAWLGMIYLGVVTNGLVCACWLQALKSAPASELSSLGYLDALLAALLSILLLHEKMSLLFIFSALLTIGGMWLIMKKAK